MNPPPIFKSSNIAELFRRMLHGPALARELAELIQTESKQIYPRLKRYIIKGWIQVNKVNNLNIYSLSDKAKQILSQKGSFEQIMNKAERILGRKLDKAEEEILRFFYEKNSYIERTDTETIPEIIYNELGRKISLYRIEQILNEFTAHSILFAYRLRNGLILKVRLNKKLLE